MLFSVEMIAIEVVLGLFIPNSVPFTPPSLSPNMLSIHARASPGLTTSIDCRQALSSLKCVRPRSHKLKSFSSSSSPSSSPPTKQPKWKPFSAWGDFKIRTAAKYPKVRISRSRLPRHKCKTPSPHPSLNASPLLSRRVPLPSASAPRPGRSGASPSSASPPSRRAR